MAKSAVESVKYTIQLKDEKIVVEHFSPSGGKLEVFDGKTATELAEKLGRSNAASDAFHYLDLGMELQKAQIALEQGLPYIQDKPLQFSFKKEEK